MSGKPRPVGNIVTLNVEQQRAETMTEIMQEASKRMQVILLTCRSKAPST